MISYTKGSFTIGNHDEYTLGQFRDDRFALHDHTTHAKGKFGGAGEAYSYLTNKSQSFCTGGNGAYFGGRTEIDADVRTGDAGSGNVTHGKQVGVNYLIKAL